LSLHLARLPSQEAYSNACEGKTSLKFPGHNQLTESDNIKHSDSTCADNGNMHALQRGQNDQTAAFVAQPVMQHKDVWLD
jgi:hypothetical protein